MKPHSILSCFFAAYGIYLTVSGAYDVIITAASLWMFLNIIDESALGMTILQHAAVLLKPVISIALVLFARPLGRLAAKFAGVANAPEWQLNLTPRSLLTVLLATSGVVIAVGEIGGLVRSGWLFFLAKAGGPEVAEMATRSLPDHSYLISSAVGLVVGILLARKSRVVARLLLPEKTSS